MVSGVEDKGAREKIILEYVEKRIAMEEGTNSATELTSKNKAEEVDKKLL